MPTFTSNAVFLSGQDDGVFVSRDAALLLIYNSGIHVDLNFQLKRLDHHL